MHFKLKGVLGIAVPVMLGGALAAGALALPAHAQSYQDTALSATQVTDGSYGGSLLRAANDVSAGKIDLTGTGVITWSLHTAPSYVGVSSTTGGAATISCSSSCMAATETAIVADATDSNGNIEALAFTVVTKANPISIQITASTTPTLVTVTNVGDTNNSNGTVTFSATSTPTNTLTFSFAESNLPTGLTSGNPLTYSGGTAAPNTYTGVKVTATNSDGAALSGTFSLTVSANTVSTTGSEGDYVNKFGNGFDSYRQHEYAGAVIAGWPATQGDPATHFLDNTGTHSGAIQLEYAPNGTATGLCVSDPGGGWASDPLPDGLILTNCNTGPFQQFIPQSDGTLRNLATGLIVNPDGKGAQLRGESSAVSWGGSSYTWTAYSNLP